MGRAFEVNHEAKVGVLMKKAVKKKSKVKAKPSSKREARVPREVVPPATDFLFYFPLWG
jgi:hypothetical protein